MTRPNLSLTPAFSLGSSLAIQAPIERIHPLINDLRAWQKWSPWEGLDPELQRTYSGPANGVGAHYEWSGNKRAGRGAMEIIDSTPNRITIDVRLLEPFKANNVSAFDLEEIAAGKTRVVWTMTGTRNPVFWLAGKFYFDRAITQDFTVGLLQLRSAVRPHWKNG